MAGFPSDSGKTMEFGATRQSHALPSYYWRIATNLPAEFDKSLGTKSTALGYDFKLLGGIPDCI